MPEDTNGLTDEDVRRIEHPEEFAGEADVTAAEAGTPVKSATREEWDAYATGIGLDPSEYTTKDDLIAAVEASI